MANDREVPDDIEAVLHQALAWANSVGDATMQQLLRRCLIRAQLHARRNLN